MSIWLFRAGKSGEFENKFLQDGRVYLTWTDLKTDLRNFKEKKELYSFLVENYNLAKEKTAVNWASQIWPVAHSMKKDDWVVLPSKVNRTIHFGRIIGDYMYEPKAEDPYHHYREVDWFAQDIPRDNLDQDILYSLGAFMTVCRIKRNNAEERLKEMYKNDWKNTNKPSIDFNAESDEDADIDLEEFIFDKISERIIQRYKGHEMERLIEAILKAKGYTTYRSPEGADQGVDLLASSGAMGFDVPRICVQVKTQNDPISRTVLDQLIGTMSNYNAEFGLLVSWNGFKSSVTKEIPKQFFRVRLWDSKRVIKEIFENYDRLSDDIKADIPLKKVWMLNLEE